MNRFFTLYFVSCFVLLAGNLYSQEILLQEDFNNCILPDGWTVDITNDMTDGFIIGSPTNAKSDSSTIDGTCMLIFDDDLLGGGSPLFRAEVKSPIIYSNDYQTVKLQTDIHFRQYGPSYFSVFLEDLNGERTELRRFDQDDQTGSRFSDYITYSLDLKFVTDLSSFHIVYVYDDGGDYAWWAAMDNVRIIGSGAGEVLISEQFNDCATPEGWSTNVLKGDNDWQFGLIDNNNSQSSSMNGSCFVYFDDDGLGQEAPFSAVELISPVIDGSAFAEFQMDFDLIIRRYSEQESFSIHIFDGTEYHLVREFTSNVAGPQMISYESLSVDLTPFRKLNMQIVFRFDDGNSWGWWTGLDNVKVIGSGQINDVCSTAIPLTIGGACQSSNNINAVFTGPNAPVEDRLVGSLWYKMTVPADGILEFENSSNYNDYLNVYTGDCENLVEIISINKDSHGFDGETAQFIASKDQELTFRVSGIVSDFGLSKGDNCIKVNYITQLPEASIEDIFTSSVNIEIDSDCQEATNVHASTAEDKTLAENKLFTADVWYNFNIAEDLDIEVNVEADFAENIAIYRQSGELVHTQIYGGPFQLEDLSLGTYIMQVAGVFATIEGNFCASINSISLDEPVADNCSEAMTVQLDELILFDNTSSHFSGIYPECDIHVDKDAWFAFTSSEANFIYLEFDSEFANTLSIYKADCSLLDEAWCAKNIDKCAGPLLIEDLEPSTDYYLQVSSSTTFNGLTNGAFEFRFSEEKTLYEETTLSVSTICNEDGTASLEILTSGSNDYVLSGNTQDDILLDGESYLVVLSDSRGCEQTFQGVISCQSTTCALQTGLDLTYPNCASSETGAIKIIMSGGLAPYSYEWDHTTENIAELNNINEGIYQVKITDFNGCFTYEEIEIIAPSALSSILVTTDQTNATMDNGTATLDIEGGIFPYNFNWSNGETEQNLTELAPGTYSVTVSDYNGCEDIHDFIINDLDCSFTVQSELTNVSCFGENNGEIVLSSEIEIANVIWDNDSEGTTLSDLSAGIYTATITATDNCETILEFTIEEPMEISLTAELTSTSCYGIADGQAVIELAGGSGNISILWEDGSSEPTRSDLPAGDYNLIATDESSCTNTSTLTITQPDSLIIVSEMVENLSCSDSHDGTICVFVEGGTQPYNFNWSNTDQTTSKLTDLSAGTYELQFTDNNSCDLSAELIVEAPLPLEWALDFADISNENDGEIGIFIDGGTDPYTVNWYNSEGEFLGTGASIDSLYAGIYYAEIVDANGCTIITDEFELGIIGIFDSEDIALEIYPNPAKESFRITSESINLFEQNISMISEDSKVVSDLIRITKSDKTEAIIDCSSLQSGVYFILIKDSNGKLTSRSQSIIILE